jgi:hypothetical protein
VPNRRALAILVAWYAKFTESSSAAGRQERRLVGSGLKPSIHAQMKKVVWFDPRVAVA